MLNLLTKLMAIYKSNLSTKRLSRRNLIQAQLAEANALIPQIDELQSEVEREQAELITYLDTVSE